MSTRLTLINNARFSKDNYTSLIETEVYAGFIAWEIQTIVSHNSSFGSKGTIDPF